MNYSCVYKIFNLTGINLTTLFISLRVPFLPFCKKLAECVPNELKLTTLSLASITSILWQFVLFVVVPAHSS